MSNAKLISALLWVAAATVGVLDSASAHESGRPHVHIGGGLPYPPFIWITETRYYDIVYDPSAPDTHLANLDVYVGDSSEPSTSPAPVMVWVHGGGSMTDKAAALDLGPKAEYFTHKLGYVLVSINYGSGPTTGAQDVANALAWVHSNIGEFGGDPNQIFLMGHSAGANLGARVATDDSYLKKAGTELRILKGVILTEGIYGAVAGDEDVKRNEAMYGAQWRKTTPIANVASGKNIPPALLLFVNGRSIAGNTDVQAAKLAEALQGAGVRADLVPLDHVEHFGANARLGIDGDITTVSTERFLASIPGNKRPAKWVQGQLPKFMSK